MLTEKVKQDFQQYILQAEKGNAFTQIREHAFAEFEKLGFPTIKQEEWK